MHGESTRAIAREREGMAVKPRCREISMVTLIPIRNPELPLAQPEVVLTDVGERADRRRRPGLRVAAPAKAQRLQHMWNTSISQGMHALV